MIKIARKQTVTLRTGRRLPVRGYVSIPGRAFAGRPSYTVGTWTCPPVPSPSSCRRCARPRRSHSNHLQNPAIQASFVLLNTAKPHLASYLGFAPLRSTSHTDGHPWGWRTSR
eukprot:scaffold3917_cov377-Prasinococcus_capsulatus_cf.AAC.13